MKNSYSILQNKSESFDQQQEAKKFIVNLKNLDTENGHLFGLPWVKQAQE